MQRVSALEQFEVSPVPKSVLLNSGTPAEPRNFNRATIPQGAGRSGSPGAKSAHLSVGLRYDTYDHCSPLPFVAFPAGTDKPPAKLTLLPQTWAACSRGGALGVASLVELAATSCPPPQAHKPRN